MDSLPKDFADKPEELKFTPNTAREMRFGPDGKARPRARRLATDEVPRPVNLKKVRHRTDRIFGVVFGVVAALMVAGALAQFAVPFLVDWATATPEVEAAQPGTPDEAPAKEIQGGIKVRKGLQK